MVICLAVDPLNAYGWFSRALAEHWTRSSSSSPQQFREPIWRGDCNCVMPMLVPTRMDPSKRTDNLPKTLVLAAIVSVGLAGCGQSSGGGTGAGGRQSTGGTTSPTGGSGGTASGAMGGRDGSGGTTSAGGAASGGMTGTGGAAASGGTKGSGGVPGTGGTTAVGAGGSGAGGSGGASTKGTGGATGSGGASDTGSGSTGGLTGATGGIGGAGTGGRSNGGAASGGATGTGGTTGTGGGIGGAGTGGSTTGGASGTEATIVPDPSWTCGMPDGIPPPTAGTLVFSVALTVSATHDVGNTQFGHRRQLDVSGGTITGDKLKGTVLTGGLDYELTLSTGAMELEEVLIWKTSDNVNIFTRICGVAAAGDSAIRIVPDIEAPTAGSYAWLNTTKLVGTRVVATGKIQLDIYDVSKVTVGDPKIQLKDPAGVPNVSWDCVTASGTDGATVFTENVTLGSTIIVSNAKRGSRNIIPITGGTTTGSKESGSILNGGADYQLAGSSGTTLDARYTLAPSNGEFIIVRNCGPMNGLTPVFEARTDGAYAFLTTGKFLSSAPGSGSGGVSITFYERK